LVPLLFQTLGVLASAVVLRAFVVRLRGEVGMVQATALAIVLFLAVITVPTLRDRWKGLDVLRKASATLGPADARSLCRGVGIDQDFLGFVGARVPVRGSFYLEVDPRLRFQGEWCIRFVLLPRTQVSCPDGTTHSLVFWNPRSKANLHAAERLPGAVVGTHDPNHVVVTLP
jgi:hypothetical protein